MDTNIEKTNTVKTDVSEKMDAVKDGYEIKSVEESVLMDNSKFEKLQSDYKELLNKLKESESKNTNNVNLEKKIKDLQQYNENILIEREIEEACSKAGVIPDTYKYMHKEIKDKCIVDSNDVFIRDNAGSKSFSNGKALRVSDLIEDIKNQEFEQNNGIFFKKEVKTVFEDKKQGGSIVSDDKRYIRPEPEHRS